METSFTLAQLADPAIKESEQILRKCVHCGFCIATCPTYVLLGDENDSPRGRIYMIKDMLETGRPASGAVVRHVDRCLSCLSCMTTCPSGVDYRHLVDHARVHIERTHARPLGERLLRGLLALVVPHAGRFRLSLTLARPFRGLAGLLPGRLGGIVAMAPDRIAPASPMDRPQVHAAVGERRMRVALLTGCAQRVLRPEINEATIRVLTRHGCEVVVAPGAGCCGALVHHMGREDDAHIAAIANVRAWTAVADDGGLDAIVINASGCGTTVRDYGFMLRGDPLSAKLAARISALARDVSEVLVELDIKPANDDARPTVAYHAPCSLQHGQRIHDEPRSMLMEAGFELREIAEGHLCCGSAGTYNLLQPELASKLLARKVANIEATGADIVAGGNIGCIEQIARGTRLPVVHPVELVDWATGGPKPRALGG
jgi:glycolate oxidase iron-sulfur subunit